MKKCCWYVYKVATFVCCMSGVTRAATEPQRFVGTWGDGSVSQRDILNVSMTFCAAAALSAVIVCYYRRTWAKKSPLPYYQMFNRKEFNLASQYIGAIPPEFTQLKKYISTPQMRRDYAKACVSLPSKFLLLGASGVGKTYAGKCLAGELGIPTIYLTAGNIMDKFLGNSEKNMQRLADDAQTIANKKGYCLVLLDEAQGIIGRKKGTDGCSEARNRTLDELLAILDGKTRGNQEGVVIWLACTYFPQENIEGAVFRPGRFRPIELPELDQEAVRKLLNHYVLGTNCLDEGNNPAENDVLASVWNAYGSRITPSKIKGLVHKSWEAVYQMRSNSPVRVTKGALLQKIQEYVEQEHQQAAREPASEPTMTEGQTREFLLTYLVIMQEQIMRMSNLLQWQLFFSMFRGNPQ